jgi:hypothetical protein
MPDPDAYLGYLFTQCVVSNYVGRASQETSFSAMYSASFLFTHAVLFRPAHLVAHSCLYFSWNFSLFAIALTSLGIAFQLSVTLTLKKFILSFMRPYLIERFRRITGRSGQLPCQTTAMVQVLLCHS